MGKIAYVVKIGREFYGKDSFTGSYMDGFAIPGTREEAEKAPFYDVVEAAEALETAHTFSDSSATPYIYRIFVKSK